VVHKNGESLREFIQRFCNKRNIISEADEKSIIMFFKGLKDSSLIRKLSTKNPRMPEEMLAIANKYAMTEEVTLDTREQKKDKELGHSDWPNNSKSHDNKRKADHSMNNVEQPRRNKEYWPRPGQFEGFLNQICIFHPPPPQEKHNSRDYDRLQGFTDEVLKTAKNANQEKKTEDPKGDFPKAHKEVNYIFGGPDSYESRRKQKLTTRGVMEVLLATPEYLKWSHFPHHLRPQQPPGLCTKAGAVPSHC
jgi:hypothetical protein